MTFMDGILLYSSHCNKCGMFSRLIFVDVAIWAPRESSRKSFSQGSNAHRFSGHIFSPSYTWEISRQTQILPIVFSIGVWCLWRRFFHLPYIETKIGIFGWLIFGVAIWDPVKPEIYCLTRLLLRMATLLKSFQTMLYFGTCNRSVCPCT